MVEKINFQLSKAHELAQEAHDGQFRAEGLPYFTHPVEVARILREEWKINDENILCAAILHDIVEDTDVTLKEIKIAFGEDVAKLVDGVSKFRSENGNESSDRETVRKVFDRTLIDPRVAVLKIADRLHNMRTLESMPRDKQLAKSRETLSVYSKLAESLGMWMVMNELEDLSFKYLNITEYGKWKERLKNDPRNSDLFMAYTLSSLEAIVRESDVNAQVVVRKNTLWRLRQKSERITRFEDNNDAVSFRVIVEDNERPLEAKDNCYKLLGRFREAYLKEENYDRFRDYYVRSKDNKYSAIQMTINTLNGAVEIAITSSSKEEFNNWGVVSLLKKEQKELSEYALKLVFTPLGQVKFFPKEATGVDFAYSISPR
ncbi:MAG: HD domain-containing protein, partial [Candidatus Curtissbacteria bacterium]|nr:HD domain-containing protein [Candidatus Curtissbacteria bacterium]